LREGRATASLLAERHTVRPKGVEGGCDGATGGHFLISEGEMNELPAKTTVALEAGDAIIVRTAGGGGFGSSAQRDPVALERDARDGIEPAP
jgi:N-methylhydantoinase B/oxoprolinase/acetone carboxylase alpha subunit